MIRRGEITVYLSLIFLIMLSFIMALLESARSYAIGTMTERYADMAAEMVFASYVKPLAERYDLLAADAGADGTGLMKFEDYLKLNMEQSSDNQGRIFDMYGIVQSVTAGETASLKDNEWEALLKQIEDYEKYALGETAVDALKSLLTELTETDVNDTAGDYADTLLSDGKAMDAAVAESEQAESERAEEGGAEGETGSIEKGSGQTANTGQGVSDPRKGISRWLKGGLLNLVMGDKNISGRSIDVSDCSWQTAKSKSQTIVSSFEDYSTVADVMEEQRLTEQISKGIENEGRQLLVNLYISDKFSSLTGVKDEENETVLLYEMEYILYGRETDQENLECAVTDIFMLRTLLNLVYLYSSAGRNQDLQTMVLGLSALSAIPVAGEVLKLLLMICWASAEAVVDCAALADGKKVPLMKNDSSWNLTMEQLAAIAKNGGNASGYVRDGSKGINYEQYLLLLMFFTADEKKLIRMTQLMECNIRLESGYEQFKLSQCVTSAGFSGSVSASPLFFQAAGTHEFSFTVGYGY